MKRKTIMSLLFLAVVSVAAFAQDQVERKKIEYLIASVDRLQGAKFIRNGSEHNGKEAASHLRMKLEKAGDKVRTADDFIRLCASKSYLSGKPYRIKYADGKIINSEQFFREKLLSYKPGAE